MALLFFHGTSLSSYGCELWVRVVMTCRWIVVTQRCLTFFVVGEAETCPRQPAAVVVSTQSVGPTCCGNVGGAVMSQL